MSQGRLTNTRFVDIGSNRVVLAGTTEGFPDYKDGQTFYSDPIDAIDGNVVKCGEQSYKFERSFSNV